VQKLNGVGGGGDTLPKWPLLDTLNNNNNGNGLFDHRNDINLLERIKDNHKNLLLNIQNNNNNRIAKRYLKQCEFFNENKYDASSSSSTSSTSSQIDVSSSSRRGLKYMFLIEIFKGGKSVNGER
jgi:hypothetical protein